MIDTAVPTASAAETRHNPHWKKQACKTRSERKLDRLLHNWNPNGTMGG
jgi:hypothetical protein